MCFCVFVDYVRVVVVFLIFEREMDACCWWCAMCGQSIFSSLSLVAVLLFDVFFPLCCSVVDFGDQFSIYS